MTDRRYDDRRRYNSRQAAGGTRRGSAPAARRSGQRPRRGIPAGAFILCAAVLAAIILIVILKSGVLRRAEPALEADLSGRVVCIDPGHGGSQAGAEAEGVRESELNLAVALRVRDILEGCGARVIMTRERDEDVPLETRAGIANDAGAEIFVSIHQNMSPENESVSGSETWVYSAETADAVALASQIQSGLTAEFRSEDRGICESSGLVVLSRTQMTACLVECGFMSNRAELGRLSSADGQSEAAYGIAEGIAAYLRGDPAPSYTVIRQS